jgi:hypothetical protein
MDMCGQLSNVDRRLNNVDLSMYHLINHYPYSSLRDGDLPLRMVSR